MKRKTDSLCSELERDRQKKTEKKEELSGKILGLWELAVFYFCHFPGCLRGRGSLFWMVCQLQRHQLPV